jgi:decaprenylphospho-beta-D-ribofuranose 2-oxidase
MNNDGSVKTSFISFDGGVRADGVLRKPDRYRYFQKGKAEDGQISRGSGLSYAPASFLDRGTSISHASFNRVTGLDTENCFVEVEAGITLNALFSFLYSRGLYLPIQPGHGCITIGGCIAANVHGKNPARDGNFVNLVESLNLFHPDHGFIEVSRDNEPNLFRLTCGGFGLTGNIISAKLRLVKIPSLEINLVVKKFDEPINGLQQLINITQEVDFAYTWHDLGSPESSSFGNGYIFYSNFEKNKNYNSSQVLGPIPILSLSAEKRGNFFIPFLNRYTVKAMNLVYKFNQLRLIEGKKLNLYDALFPVQQSQIYFKLFGARGFHEYQVILPINSLAEFFKITQEYTKKHSIPITLATAKSFNGLRELLRYSASGVSIAINLPRSKYSFGFMEMLDKLVVELDGVPNIIKDSRLSRKMVENCYPGIEEFRKGLREIDPRKIYQSELSKRLQL